MPSKRAVSEVLRDATTPGDGRLSARLELAVRYNQLLAIVEAAKRAALHAHFIARPVEDCSLCNLLATLRAAGEEIE